MTMGFWPARLWRGVFTAGLGVSLSLSASGCASSEYAGISLEPGTASADLQVLARRAQAGDKYAQLALGVRYEEGRGVPRDLAKSKTLYARAASDSDGTLWVYSPGNGKAKGRVVPIDSGPRQAGLSEAKSRLSRLTAPAGTRAISDIAFGGDGPVPNSVRADRLAANSSTPSRLSQDVPIEPQDLPLGSREEGDSLLRACRSKPELDSRAFSASGPFEFGYCQGYIRSKLYRLSSEKLAEIEVRRRHLQGDIPVFGSDITLDILNILRSSQFGDGGFDGFKRYYSGPFTAEKVLDYVINNLLYTEPR
ncbi:hypothetical protein NDN01_17630 [Sphingomonas sp. QA11]|uniref:hypothetical protein n=1 Tax=Sphingomonas sp. QA11 TaxID=2950605 RepID=UPI00234B26BE|nr:hypothetical protein [Sphingomonas sp. QA11]WCM25839.1 hypothetical protein NDN01_17630 [Sphingomonas sp. QA11]